MAHEPSDQIARQLREAWFRYLDTVEPIRPGLYRYCRRVTRNVWDAEDLVSETLLRGFGGVARGDKWGNPRAYLFRIATNVWIDELRRDETRRENEAQVEPAVMAGDSMATRDAAARLFASASPQERTAVLLKDVFNFTIEEIAEMLSTTAGAIKAALHRGRARTEQAKDVVRSNPRAPSKELLDRFVAAFEARDVDRVKELLLENVTLEHPGMNADGKAGIWVQSSMDIPTPNNPEPPRRHFVGEVIQYQGEWIVVTWQAPRADAILAGVNRFEVEDGRIARIWEYYFCPDTIAEIAAALGARAVSHGYRHAPGVLSRIIASAELPWDLAEIRDRQS